jgi:DNA polymerase-3 subunit gamma/tau
MSFVVSARKYRPKSFDEVLGQRHVTDTLKSAILSDKLAHAFLFTGPRGVGKTTCARILAKVINAPDPKKAITEKDFGDVEIDVSLNIFELDAASNNSVENIRSLIEQVRFQPQQGKYKIFIIDEVHMLSTAAFNAFLKTLEEPPPYAIFILATTEKHKILPTILSRCQIFDFKRIQVSEVIDQLDKIAASENITIDDDSKYAIAEMADGGMRDALSIFDRIASSSEGKIDYDDLVQKLNLLDQDYYFRMVDALASQDKSAVLILFNEVLMNGFEGDHFIMGLADHFRNVLLCKDAASVQLLEASESVKGQFVNQAQLLSTSYLMTALHLCNDCDVNYPKAKNKRLHAEITLLKICYINQLIEHQASAGSTLEKKTPDSSIVAANPLSSSSATKADLAVTVEPVTSIDSSHEPSQSISKELEESPVRSQAPQPTEKSTEVKENSIKEPSQTPEVVAAAAPSASATSELKNTPSFASVDSLLAKVKEDFKAEEALKSEEIKLEDILVVWQNYRDKTVTPSTKGVLEKSMLDLSDEGLKITVASVIAKEIIQQEIPLMQEIRKSIRNSNLDIEILVDKAQFPETELSKPKKYLGFKEKYELMLAKNQSLEKLVKKLELKKDNNAV